MFSAVTRAIPRRALCKRRTLLPSQVPSSQARCLSTSTARLEEMSTDRVETPRWQSTPSRMVAPLRSRPKPADNEFRVNEDPQRLDQVYKQILGTGGEKMLTEHVKWLAVTHKSYDHGRRGFNDRLAFLGMPLFPSSSQRRRRSNTLTWRGCRQAISRCTYNTRIGPRRPGPPLSSGNRSIRTGPIPASRSGRITERHTASKSTHGRQETGIAISAAIRSC